jgi:O-methyltransferase
MYGPTPSTRAMWSRIYNGGEWTPHLDALLRRGPGSPYRKLASLRFLLTRDRAALVDFLAHAPPARDAAPTSVTARAALVADMLATTDAVRGYHTLDEMLRIARRILALAGRPDLTVVECGVAKGSSTAKLGRVCRLAGARLVALDSFRGIPPNDERHENLDGRPVRFHAGAFTGRLASVERVLAAHGAPERTTLVKGWFEDTLPTLDVPVDVAVLDVDLASSTETCVRHLYPRLRPGGSLFTQDGHLRAIVARLGDPRFWREVVGVEPPSIGGLGRDKLLEIRRPDAPAR